MHQDIAPIVAIAQNPAATSAAIGAALDQARAASAEAEAARAAADCVYQDGLLALDDKALGKLAGERTAAEVRCDRTRALVAKLESGLAEAQAREAESARMQAYAAALDAREEAAARLRNEYPQLVALGLDLLHAIATADAAIEDANRDLPAGAERLQSTEAVARTIPGLPREVIEDVEVTLWCRDDEPVPAPEEIQPRVIAQGNGRGYFSTGTGQHYFVARPFRRVSFRPAVRPLYTTALAEVLALPALQPGDALEWTPEAAGRDGPSSSSRILARLALVEQAASTAPTPPRRSVEVEYLPVASRRAA